MLVLIRASRDTFLIYGQQARDYLIDRPIFLAQTPNSVRLLKVGASAGLESRHPSIPIDRHRTLSFPAAVAYRSLTERRTYGKFPTDHYFAAMMAPAAIRA
jgi:hypothetical protein